MKRLLAFFLIFVLLLGVASCKRKDPVEEDVFFTVTFVTTALPYEAAPPEKATVKQGESVTAPTLSEEPSAGYVVIWTRDLSQKSEYDFASAVTADITLYAVEVPRTYRITYLLERGTNVKANPTTFTKATETFYLQKPNLENVFGYKFIKWAYYDDPDSAVEMIEKGTEGDQVLRAVFEPVEYFIRYLEAEDNPNPTTYVFGTTLSLESPLKEGYTFRGFTIADDPNETPVVALDADFIVAHREQIFYRNGVDIWLQANWEKDE